MIPQGAMAGGECHRSASNIQGNGLQVRALQLADMAEVCRIQADCYVAVTPESAASLAAKVRAAPASCFVAEADGRALAYVIAIPWQQGGVVPLDSPECVLPSVPDCLYIHDLAVHPDAAGLGVGSRLLAPVLQAARTLGLPRQCLVAVQGAQAFWERQGFASVAVDAPLRRKLAGYGEDAVYMLRHERASPARLNPATTSTDR